MARRARPCSRAQVRRCSSSCARVRRLERRDCSRGDISSWKVRPWATSSGTASSLSMRSRTRHFLFCATTGRLRLERSSPRRVEPGHPSSTVERTCWPPCGSPGSAGHLIALQGGHDMIRGVNRVLVGSFFVLFLASFGQPASATVLTFEGLTSASAESMAFHEGYGGFVWDTGWYLFSDISYSPPGSVSPHYGIVNNFGSDPLSLPS